MRRPAMTLVFGFVLVVSACEANPSLRPFTSDGCSAFPNGTMVQGTLWLRCCTAHDYAYWQGGSYAERKAADEALRDCVSDVGEAQIAVLMLAGVRVGGTPYLPTRFRWGYGWPWPRGYHSLTDLEVAQVERLSAEVSLELQMY